MGTVVQTWLHDGNARALKKSLAILVAVSAVALIAACWVYVPLQVDGSWYGYHAYALSQSRDAGENFAPLETLDRSDGLRVSFDFDERHLRVLPMSLWFKAFGTSIWAVKSYSMLELLAFLAALAFALARAGASMRVVFLVFLFVLSDTVPLTLAAADLRPDLAVLALTLLIFGLTVADRRSMSVTRAIVAAFLSFVLVLTHLTSAIALSVLAGSMAADLWLSRSARTVPRALAYGAVLAVGFVGLLFDHFLHGSLIPTAFDPSQLYYPAPGRGFDMVKILSLEAGRWHGYFFESNVSTLAVLLLAAFALPYSISWRSPKAPATRALIAPLAFGIVCGILVLTFVDPHYLLTPHAFSVVVCSLLLAGLTFDALPETKLRRFGYAILVLLCTASLAKLALAAKIAWEAQTSGISNAIIQRTVAQEFTDRHADVVLGPTKLWAYADPSTDTLIIDRRSSAADLTLLQDFIGRVDLIVVDREYADFQFVDHLKGAYPQLSLQLDKQLGDPASQNFLTFYAVSNTD